MIICENKNQCDCLTNMDIEATVDNNVGNPNVTVTKNNNKVVFAFSGLKGAIGQPGSNGSDGAQGNPGLDGKTGTTPKLGASAHIGQTIGEPNVEVTVSGSDEEPVFNFTFNGIRGNDGHDGRDGVDGIDGVNGRDGKDGLDAKAEDIERAVRTEIETQLEQMDADMQTLTWLKYAIDGYENDEQAFARLIAAARDYKDNGKTKLDEAYAGVNALVVKQQDGTYRASSFLTSLIGSNDGQGSGTEGWSGVITSADIHDAMVDVFANYTNDANTMTARIFALANANGSTIKLKADQINLNGRTWADIISFGSMINDAFSGDGTYNNVTIDSESIQVSGASTGTKSNCYTIIEPDQITIHKQSSGNIQQATISPNSFAIGNLEYDNLTRTLSGANSIFVGSGNDRIEIDSVFLNNILERLIVLEDWYNDAHEI